MGFRQGAYAKIWSVDDHGKYSTGNISISKRNKDTGEYTIDFRDGYVRFVGQANEYVKKLNLPDSSEAHNTNNKGALIRIGACDVSQYYNATKKELYTNFTIFEIQDPNGNDVTNTPQDAKRPSRTPPGMNATNQTKPLNDFNDDELPF